MSAIKVALVIGKTEFDLEVVDLIRIMPLDATHYIIETPHFMNSNLLTNGAGERFSMEQLIKLLSSIHPSVHPSK